VVGGDYFKALQIPLVDGRVFTDSDTADSPRVVVVDQLLVNRYFKNESALGRQINRGGPNSPGLTIVGVVGTVNTIDLGEPVQKERIYHPVAQQGPASMALVIKTGIDPMNLVAPVRAAVASIDPEQPIAQVRTLDQWMARSLETRRAPMLLLTLFGVLALALSGIGIYGVLAFGVAERVREFGIRQALGADRGAILSMVMRQGLKTVAIGIVIGVAGAFGLTRYLQSLLFGVGTHDAVVFAGVTVVLLAVALAAGYVPARRATRIDPMDALRQP
jgi:predicted permease